MSNKAQIVILCEDSVHYHFSKKYLELLGFNGKKIIGYYNPKGRSVGSGVAYVIGKYEREINALRSKSYLDCILVVMIDDDAQDNIRLLHNIYKPKQNEKIFILSPKRTIESWFYYIDTRDCSVEFHQDKDGNLKSYKQNYRNPKPTQFAKKLKNEICYKSLPQDAPDSLQDACGELARLLTR